MMSLAYIAIVATGLIVGAIATAATGRGLVVNFIYGIVGAFVAVLADLLGIIGLHFPRDPGLTLLVNAALGAIFAVFLPLAMARLLRRDRIHISR